MRIGKITQTAWQRYVRKQLHTETDDAMSGASPWESCSFLENGCLRADAHASGDDGRAGYYAVYHAAGELAARNVQPRSVSVRVLFPPGSSDEMLSETAAGADCACRETGARITAFQGEVTGAVAHTVVFASAAGIMEDNKGHGEADQAGRSGKKIPLHREIVQCGYAGLEGTLRILDAAQPELERRFVSTFIEQAKTLTNAMVRPDQILKVYRSDKEAVVRQIGSGGILASLWELAETVRTGFEIEMPQINLKQETVEICEFYRLNPYLMTSAGSYLILTSQAESVIRALEEAGAPAVRLGEARDQNARVIRNGEEIRYLDRPAPDELERWRTEH